MAAAAAGYWSSVLTTIRDLMATTAPAQIFKAYDVRGLYGDEIDGDVAESIGRAFARVLSDLAGKPVGELRIGLGREDFPEVLALFGRWLDRVGPRADGDRRRHQ